MSSGERPIGAAKGKQTKTVHPVTIISYTICKENKNEQKVRPWGEVRGSNA